MAQSRRIVNTDKLIEFRWFNTYSYANIVFGVLQSQFEYIRQLHDFFENDAYLYYAEHYRRKSILHCFIEYTIDVLSAEEEDDEETRAWMRKHRRTPLNEMYRHYGIKHTSFNEWLTENPANADDDTIDLLQEYECHLKSEDSYEALMNRASSEVFHILFANRTALLLLNELASGYIAQVTIHELEASSTKRALFVRDGVLRRRKTPSWALRAVYFRDRGRCVFCNCDLSGVVSLLDEKNYDHIVPLDRGGLNDVTNLQLTCSACNKIKNTSASTMSRYETWYELREESQE